MGWRRGVTLAVWFFVPVTARAQVLETETARLLSAGRFEFSSNFEYQFSVDGRETTIPLAFEYGLSDTWEALIEPVPYTRIRPAAATGAAGLGDLEVTVVHRVLPETGARPALALAGEVKLPFAESRLIGTDMPDFTAYAIVSRRIRSVELHANLGYTVLGRPAGIAVQNVVDFAFAATLDVAGRTKLFTEVLGNTSASPGAGEGGAASEVGGELSATVGAGYGVTSALFVSLGLSYDISGAVLLRPGFTLRLH